MRRFPALAVLLLASALTSLHGQQETTTPTLHVNARAVLVDVVVTDAHGNPIPGLPQSAFHISDDGRPQKINAFDVHAGQSASQPALHHFAHSPTSPVSNVLLIDTSKMNVLVQMAVYKQLQRFIQDLPPHMPVAVFLRAYAAPVMLQNFTTDHALLDAAIRRAIPHLQMFAAGVSQPEAADFIGPQRVADYLAQVPGRKNLLWFVGGMQVNAPLGLADAGISPGPGADNQDLRRTFDLLQTARVSIYPIDVRGLEPEANMTQADQHLAESGYADETGGRVFYNTNDITAAAQDAVENGENFYTISYSPDDLKNDGSWHSIRLTVDGGNYQLSYRRGYYDDTAARPGKPAESRTAMISVKDANIAQPDARAEPLVFRVAAAPAQNPGRPPRRGNRFWKVHYDIPAVELQHTFTNGAGASRAGAAIVAFNQAGRLVGHVSQEVTLKFTEAAYNAEPNAALSFDQLVEIPANQPAFLYIALWDAANGRMGTVNLTADTRRHKKH